VETRLQLLACATVSARLPARLQPPPVAAADFRRWCDLCTEIEALATGNEDGRLSTLLAEWNGKAHHEYTPVEFKTYYGAVSKEEFVRDALSPRPRWIEDLTFEEAREAVAAIMSAEPTREDTCHALRVLDLNLPGGELSDLMYWPNEWFGDEQMLRVELTPAQVLEYAMARAGRRLVGSPDDIELPRPAPARRAPPQGH